ncbi:putative kinetochore protein NUF2 [Tetrabaena socialis]|uniref:Putative kinetochore protein NUF2 n=1 Tax=Tetrabaena socialis TaxID=47790 RepID=A0A2J8AI64_9CHLO|nr:putative kinetochore protein NUF2 [Tetrabaena socialis]|eukprot:PNH12206.1 putative kinetochore protein NUF2 [Tetrabaena socialis]
MSFSFPTNITTEEIQQCLSDLQIYVDVNHLTKPTYETVRPYYEQAVIALTGVTREELMQPKFSALSVFEYPELHDESIPTTNFFRHLTKLMMICGVRDFNLNDVFKPDVARLRRNLCALINFAKYRDEKVTLVNELEAGLAAKVAAEQALAAEYEKNVAELRRLQEVRSLRQAEVSAIESETAGTAAQNAQLNKAQAGLQNEVRGLKSHINGLTDQAAEAKITLSSLHAEAEQLQDQIVQSPEKHRLAIADLIGAAESKRTYYAALCSASNDHDRKLEFMAKFERELMRCIKLQEELEGVVARKKDVSAAAKDTREAIATEERRYSELASSNLTARRQQASLQDKLSRIEQQGQLKVEAAAALVEEQFKRREAVEAEHAAGDARAAEQEAQIRGWRERAAEVTAQKDTRARSVVDKYGMLRKAVGDYNRRLEAAVAAAQESEAQGASSLREGGLDVSQGRDAHGRSSGARAAAAMAAGASMSLQGLSLA